MSKNKKSSKGLVVICDLCDNDLLKSGIEIRTRGIFCT